MRDSNWLGALQDRSFRLFFIGQFASQVGSGMAPVAVVFAVLAHGSASDVGYVLAAETAPLIVLPLVGGVVGDRVSRRVLMLQSDVLRTAAECALGLWILLGSPPLWGFMVLAALLGVGQAFFSPSLTAIVPQMLSPERLQQGNALNGISASLGGVVGPALAGVIVAAFGPGWAILADGATYFISVVTLAAIEVREGEVPAAGSFLGQLREGWREFWSRTWLWVVVVQFSLINALYSVLFVLGPVVAKESLGGARAWGFIMACSGLGSVLGGVVMLRVHPRRPLLVGIAVLVLAVPPVFLLAARSPSAIIAMSALVGGVALSVFSVQWSTTLQREVPAAVLSRVSAYDWFGSLVLVPIAMAIFGPLSSVIGVSTTLADSGVAMVALVLVALAVPSVTGLRAPERALA